jgi:4-hydroxy-tetrahydrodipicolinate synthase
MSEVFGISAALTTPFSDDGSVDYNRLNDHIKTVLSQGCPSVTLFGTTGEGPSLATNERLATLRAVIGAKIAPDHLVLALHGAAAPEIVDQAKAALALGVARFLLPPPCYFNAPPTAGLAAWFASILSQLDGSDAKIILYHIPQVIGVGVPVDLVAHLKEHFADLVFAVKDSSGSFENTKQLLGLTGLHVLIGDERLLAPGARLGAAGAISGMANIFPARLSRVLATGIGDPGIDALVDTVVGFDVTPAIKSLVARKYADMAWRRTRAPLVSTADRDYATLIRAFDALPDPA